MSLPVMLIPRSLHVKICIFSEFSTFICNIKEVESEAEVRCRCNNEGVAWMVLLLGAVQV